MEAELERARALLNEARNGRAKAALEGVVLALRWVIEGRGGASPAETAAALQTEKAHPLDHDGDGKKGGSKSGKLATARKPKK